MFYKLPPAGDPIVSSGVSAREHYLAGYFKPYTPRFYESGTAALAAALQAAIKFKQVEDPEVVVPAYTCPAVISAVLYVGATPVLVDLEENRPWMRLDELQQRISPKTAAVIIVNFLGIPERLAEIEKIVDPDNVLLIHDSAQALSPANDVEERGDFVILSFGRGKPVTLLHGGAVLATCAELVELLPKPANSHELRPTHSIPFSVKAALYNLFRSPFLYWIPATMPFLHLGETRFKWLDAISEMNNTALGRLQGALDVHRRWNVGVQKETNDFVSSIPGGVAINLPRVCCGETLPRLLRYPLLILDPDLRDRLWLVLDTAGLGASRMYPAALPHIHGLEQTLAEQGPFPNAEAFSRSVLTLPTHSGVRTAHIRAMRRILDETLSRIT